MIGLVQQVDVDESGVGWGKFLRVKVLLDVTCPLLRGRIVILHGNSTWVPIKYESLLQLCFRCGMIAHAIGGFRLSTNNTLHSADSQV